MLLSQVRKTTEELLKKHNLFQAPIDVKILAEKLNIKVVKEDLDNSISGFLVTKNGKSTVALNKSHHKNRNRFTLAHEIGHFILHKEFDELFVEENLTYFRSNNYSENTSEMENDANNFAAELLMPKKLVTKAIEDRSLDISDESDFSDLAQLFQVSERALAIRLMKLGLLDE